MWSEKMEVINRSYLFVPGARPDRFAKAVNSGAHAAVIDLEDSVPLDDKGQARNFVAQWLDPAHPVVLRINGAGSTWFPDDLALCRKPGLSAVMLAKAERPEDVRTLAAHVAQGTAILPLIESGRGVANAFEIAECPAVQRLVFGSLDLQLDLGITEEDTELLYFRSQVVLASRLAGLQPPVESPTTAIDPLDVLRADTERARRLGFGGKLCIHPKQVPVVNDCFKPTAEEVEWATAVIAAAAASDGGAMTLYGKMVDRPVILRAQRILSDAGHDYS